MAEPEVALSANGRSATYTDVDGDTITIKTNRGSFGQDDFDLVFLTSGGVIGSQLQRINLSDDGDEFAGANIKVTAKRGPDGGDGFVNVGAIDAGDNDLGKVLIAGDLGKIEAGDGDPAKPALRSLTVQSLGVMGLSTQASGGDLTSIINGKLGQLTIKSSLRDARFSVIDGADGDIGRIVIGNSLIGGGATQSGTISAQGDIGSVQIGGDIRGGDGPNSGAVISTGNLGLVQLGGSLFGGDGAGSGSIASTGGAVKSVKIGGSVFAGTNALFPRELFLPGRSLARSRSVAALLEQRRTPLRSSEWDRRRVQVMALTWRSRAYRSEVVSSFSSWRPVTVRPQEMVSTRMRRSVRSRLPVTCQRA